MKQGVKQVDGDRDGGGAGVGLATVDREGPELEKAAGEFESVLPVLCDISAPKEVDAMVARVRAADGGFESPGLGLSALRG